MKSIGKQKAFLLSLLALLTILCVAFASALLPTKKAAASDSDTSGYKYLLAFEDDFNGDLEQSWTAIHGGSYVLDDTKTSSVKKWRFYGENHIVYKKNAPSDLGKFLYGKKANTNYMFEVKMRADVNETVGEYMETYAGNPGAGMTMNTHIPFFVTNTQSSQEFYGRSVCVNNYAIGFYEVGEDSSRWVGSATRLKTKFSEAFDWREWHTIRVEATTTECTLWLDDVLVATAANSDFAIATAANGYCGFSGNADLDYVSLHFDDFKYWKANENYVSTTQISSLSAADFRDTSKIDYASSSVSTALGDTTANKLLYNTDGAFVTDVRLLKDYKYQSFETAVAFDIERQKTAKGVGSDGSYSGTGQVRTSDMSGILFNGSFNSENKYNGYLLNYWGSYYTTAKTNTVTVQLKKLVNSGLDSTVKIGVLNNTTSCVLKVKVEGGYLYVTPYLTAEDYANGNEATFTNVATSVTLEADGSYKLALPTYDAAAGGDYTEGYFGFRCNSGGTSGRYVYDAEILDFSGAAKKTGVTYQSAAEVTAKTVSVVTPVNGSVTVNGSAASATQTVAAHSEVKLAFTPDSGYVIDSVKVNGVELGRVTEFTISNITQDYEVEVGFTNVNNVDVYILAGQSNAAGFTPAKGLYKAYTYGGTVDQDKLAGYENGYADVMYYGITKSADPANAGASWNYVRVGQGSIPTMIGPELGFAETMSGYYGGSNGKAALIKYAVGSTGFVLDGAVVKKYGNWYSPTARAKLAASDVNDKTGLLYDNLLLTVEQAISSLLKQGYEPNIKGIFWMQGCEDAKTEALANDYQEHLTDLINDLRGDLTKLMTELSHPQACADTPFVIGKIGADLQKADYEGIVREEMQKTAAAVSNVRIVETDDFTLPDVNDNNDSWHFPTKGILAIGNRFADVLLQMTGKKNAVSYQVTFNANGGTGSYPAQTVAKWLTATEPTAPQKANYAFLGWFENGSSTAWNFTANNVREDTLLTAKWEKITYTVTVTTPENGTLTTSVSGNTADAGTKITVTATPAEGYELVKITVNGETLTGTEFTLTENVTVAAEFAKKATEDTNGTGGSSNTGNADNAGGTGNTDQPSGGCFGTASLGGVSLVLALGCVGLWKKRKNK